MKKNKVIFTAGAFDLLHINHIRFLKKVKSYADYLIVGLASDELIESYKRKPILSYNIRFEMLKELNFIDKIIKQERMTKDLPISFYNNNNIDYQIQSDTDKHYYNRKDVKFIFLKPYFGLHTTNIINKIQGKIYKVCLVGGTSTSHYLASILSEKANYQVNLLTRNPDKWSKNITTIDVNGNILANGLINKISNKPEDVIPECDFVIISVPSFAIEEVVKNIAIHISDNTVLGKLPGTGGFDWVVKKYVNKKNLTIFGTQRLPLVVRKIDYGKKCLLYGQKKKNTFCLYTI